MAHVDYQVKAPVKVKSKSNQLNTDFQVNVDSQVKLNQVKAKLEAQKKSKPIFGP